MKAGPTGSGHTCIAQGSRLQKRRQRVCSNGRVHVHTDGRNPGVATVRPSWPQGFFSLSPRSPLLVRGPGWPQSHMAPLVPSREVTEHVPRLGPV